MVKLSGLRALELSYKVIGERPQGRQPDSSERGRRVSIGLSLAAHQVGPDFDEDLGAAVPPGPIIELRRVGGAEQHVDGELVGLTRVGVLQVKFNIDE
jgi:hypothetical protein